MSYYEASAIKQKIDIVAFIAQDGHQLKKSGANYFCLCPLHREKTPSCCISPTRQSFRCYGCNTGGDIFIYWQLTRNCNFKQAIQELSEITNTPASNGYRPPASPRKTVLHKKHPTSLNQRQLKQWAQACNRLQQNDATILKIAKWRGYDPGLVKWAAQTQLLGSLDYLDKLRLATPVKAPIEGILKTVATHIRIGKNSPHNAGQKDSYRYQPAGCGSWPFIIGSPATSTHLIITEGQWDALALAQLLMLHTEATDAEMITIFGLRGASAKCSEMISSEIFPKLERILTFNDSDTAGESWFSTGGLVEQLRSHTKLPIHSFSPDTANSDINAELKHKQLSTQQLLQDLEVNTNNPLPLKQLLPQRLASSLLHSP